MPKAIYFNLPPKAACERESWPGGCRYQHVLDTRTAITEKNIPLHGLVPGQVIVDKPDLAVKLAVLYAFDGTSPPKGITVNDSSAVMKLTVGNESVLFTADIGRKTGGYLAKHGKQHRYKDFHAAFQRKLDF